MTDDQVGCGIFVAVILFIAGNIWWATSSTLRQIHEEEDAKRQQKIVANYKSPVDRTDTQRLDWLTANPNKTPWTRYGTDPRHEIDFQMDTEAAK